MRDDRCTIASQMMYYNFVRVLSKRRSSLAMAAGVAERLREIFDVVALVEVEESRQWRTAGRIDGPA